ncbi:hypothetical protein [Rariglobus hedericola]|uniref:Uncharacterized protein n=1 Tax=Rariglobus hedericola TaxID=2597822 RepID=A0A556QRH5_9BACT|nr:hypothetical protein [Rariglobus hedericola]TSJ79244.1 hypothetical protein FPL22_08115 [Rariglobus hedericola]
MSLHDAIEIKQREADLKKSPWLKLAGVGLFVIGMLILVSTTTDAHGRPPQAKDLYTWVMIAGGVLYLAYCHHQHSRRIDVLELELLKLRRERSFKTQNDQQG